MSDERATLLLHKNQSRRSPSKSMRAELNKRRKKVMTMEKLTYVSAINYALKSINGESLSESEKVAVAEKLIALGQSLEKRNASKSGKPTKTQKENANVKGEILKALTAEGQKCGEIAEKVGISGQKCSALLSQMVAD